MAEQPISSPTDPKSPPIARRRRKKTPTPPDAKKKTGNGYIPNTPRYNENVDWFLSGDRLDPKNDPTLKPYVDNILREAREEYDKSTYNLHDQMARSGLLGTGFHQGQMIGADEEFNEANLSKLAEVYMGARQLATDQKLKALGLQSDRDIAEGNIRGGIAQARISIKPGMAANNLARQQWKANQPWTDLSNAMNIMQGLGGMSGHYEDPNFIPMAAPYSGLDPWAAGLLGGVGAGVGSLGSLYKMGMFQP